VYIVGAAGAVVHYKHEEELGRFVAEDADGDAVPWTVLRSAVAEVAAVDPWCWHPALSKINCSWCDARYPSECRDVAFSVNVALSVVFAENTTSTEKMTCAGC
jgi:hypothetical protein